MAHARGGKHLRLGRTISVSGSSKRQWAVARPERAAGGRGEPQKTGANFLFLFPGGTASCAFRLAAPHRGTASDLLACRFRLDAVRDDRSPTTALAIESDAFLAARPDVSLARRPIGRTRRRHGSRSRRSARWLAAERSQGPIERVSGPFTGKDATAVSR
jgi:hypothetical protein